MFALVLLVATVAVGLAEYSGGHGLIPIAWLAVGPLLASLVLSPRITAVVAGAAVLLAFWLVSNQPARPESLVSRLSVLRAAGRVRRRQRGPATAAQRRLGQARAVARAAQSALLREVPATVAAGGSPRGTCRRRRRRGWAGTCWRSSRTGPPRWLIGDTRGKELPAVRLASVAMTSFRDACAQPGLSLPEIARVVDRSSRGRRGRGLRDRRCSPNSTRTAGLQLVDCGHRRRCG